MTRYLALLAVFAAVAGCGQGKPASQAVQGPPDAGQPAAVPLRTEPQTGRLVIFLGDSLTAGYDLPEAEAFPQLIAETLQDEGIRVKVVNAGVSGDTTAGGLRRLDWLLAQKPEVVVVGLGANDGLRGQPLREIEANLRAIAERARGAGVRVLLLGMRLPPSLGSAYTRGFDAIFPRLAQELDLPLVPFFLEGVAGRPDLNLPDGLHPNARGQRIVAANVLPYLRRLLASRG